MPAEADAVSADGREFEPLVRSIVIPAFNEQERLPALLHALPDAVDPDSTELIIVDDGSTDDTVAAAESLSGWAKRQRVIEMGTNRGKGAAVRRGVAEARGAAIIFLDADNATDLAVLPELESRLQEAHAVFGSRNAPGAEVIGSPRFRGWMGQTYSRVIQRVLGTSVADSQCGCKAFRAPVAKLVFALSRLDGFAFDAEVLFLLERLGLRTVEHPVTWTHMSGSKVGLVDPFAMFLDTVRVRVPNVPPPIAYLSLPEHQAIAIEDEIRQTDPRGSVDGRFHVLVPFSDPTELDAVKSRVAVRGGEAIETGLLQSSSWRETGEHLDRLASIIGATPAP